jgi:hypothetical protein
MLLELVRLQGGGLQKGGGFYLFGYWVHEVAKKN